MILNHILQVPLMGRRQGLLELEGQSDYGARAVVKVGVKKLVCLFFACLLLNIDQMGGHQ